MSVLFSVQVRKTLDATMQTLQDMLTVEDFDVSDAFQHSRSTESIKSVASETYMSKLNVAKRRANQQETEVFYFTVSSCLFYSVCLLLLSANCYLLYSFKPNCTRAIV